MHQFLGLGLRMKLKTIFMSNDIGRFDSIACSDLVKFNNIFLHSFFFSLMWASIKKSDKVLQEVFWNPILSWKKDGVKENIIDLFRKMVKNVIQI